MLIPSPKCLCFFPERSAIFTIFLKVLYYDKQYRHSPKKQWIVKCAVVLLAILPNTSWYTKFLSSTMPGTIHRREKVWNKSCYIGSSYSSNLFLFWWNLKMKEVGPKICIFSNYFELLDLSYFIKIQNSIQNLNSNLDHFQQLLFHIFPPTMNLIILVLVLMPKYARTDL